MAGIKQWKVDITFFVEADNDDDALRKATTTLRYGESDVVWVWKDTQLINKGEASE